MGKIRYAYDTPSGGETQDKPDTGLAADPAECDQGPEVRDDVVDPREGPGGAGLEPETGEERRFYVYYLRRPDKVDPLELRPGCPFYVGKGSNGRVSNHRMEAKKLLHKSGRKLYKIAIIHKLWKQGLDFEEDIVFDNLTEQEAFETEILAIQAYGRKDNGTGILANMSDGGEGQTGYIPSTETIEKLRLANSGENHHNFGKHHKPETIEKNRQAHLGKNTGSDNPMYGKSGELSPCWGRAHTQEEIEKISKAKMGHEVLPETREKIGKANAGEKNYNYGKTHPHYGPKNHTEETKEKISAKLKGRVITEEWRRKISETKRRNKILKNILLDWQGYRENYVNKN